MQLQWQARQEELYHGVVRPRSPILIDRGLLDMTIKHHYDINLFRNHMGLRLHEGGRDTTMCLGTP